MKIEFVNLWEDKVFLLFPTIVFDYEDGLCIGIGWFFLGIDINWKK